MRWLLSLTLVGALSAQVNTGAITGSVIDPSSAAIAGARVTAREERSNTVAEAVADPQGNYGFPALVPGLYRIEAEAAGFRKLVRSGVELRVNDRLRVDLALPLGQLTESVEVTAAAALIEQESGAIGNVIDNRRILNLPLNTRNPYQLAQLSPGVLPSPAAGDAFNNAIAFSVNGGRGNTSEILIDGAVNTVQGTNMINVVVAFPSPDAIEEFKLQTNSFSAEYGRSGGGVVNMVMKSGSNHIHGVLFEFLRNSRLDANDFFANSAGLGLSSFKRNQFGGVIGGPVVKDKLFFFGSFEGLRQRSQALNNLTVPTAAERAGDFSATRRLLGTACAPLQIYDPNTTRVNPAGGFLRDVFPDNRIPASRLDPVGRRMASFLPQPGRPGDACTGLNNLFAAGSAAYDTTKYDAKIDWIPSSRNRVAFSINWLQRINLDPNVYGNIADTRQFNGDRTPSRAARLSVNRTQSPSLLLNGQISVARFKRVIDPATPPGWSLTELGFPQMLAAQAQAPMFFPVVSITEYSGLGRGTSDLNQTGSSYAASLGMTKILSRHTIKAGYDIRINQVGDDRGGSRSGNFAFARNFTQGPDPNRPANDRGNGIASLLLGLGTGNIQIVPPLLTSNRYQGWFVQDDYKLTSRLTLNLGLRYELESGRTERYNQLSWFDFDVASPLAAKTGLPIRGGIRFVGDGGSSPHQFDLDKNNFAPRFAFAYTLSPRTVLRGGYGIFYLPFAGEAAGRSSGTPGFSASTDWASSLDGVTPNDRLANPFPKGITQPQAPKSGLLTSIGQRLSGSDAVADRGSRSGYSQQWNFNIQRELAGKLSVEVAYTGSRGLKLPDGPNGIEWNQLDPRYLSLGSRLLETVPNPFLGLIDAGTLSAARVTRGQLLRPYPQYLGVLSARPATAASTYHAAQARVEKRFSNGLTLLVAYTKAKLIDDSSQTVGFLGPAPEHQDIYNRRADRAVSGLDISQRVVTNFIYDLPIGRSKAIGGSMPRLLSLAVGGWQVNGIVTFSTNVPLAIVNSQNNSNAFNPVQRPNSLGNPELPGDRPTSERLARWFDPDKFAQPAAFSFGNLGRTLPNVRGDTIRNFDLSLFKYIRIRERFRLELRGEFFNGFNTPRFASPNLNFGAGNFGRVNAQQNSPRQVQVGAKLYF